MAKTTVEFLGGQLDGTVLNNMASEATMRELLAAVKQNSGGSGGSGAKPSGSTPAAKLRKNSSVMTKLADGLGNQIGNAIGAVGSMGAMLLTGNTKLSAYTRTLNDQVISKLPIFGGLLGGVGGLLNDSIEVLEDWNDSLKLGTASGATFGNSILKASKAATASAMNLDDFMRMMSAHSPVMLNLGKTVTEGAMRFSALSRRLNREGGLATNTLRQMGYSAQDVNEAFIRYIDITGMGMRNDKKSDADLLNSFGTFQLHIIKMGYLTGKTVKQLEGQMAVANQDIVYKMQMAKLLPHQRAKMQTALTSYVSMYGESGAELFKALFLGMPPGNEDAQNLFVLMPDLVKNMRSSIDSAKHGTAEIEEFTAETESKLIKTMLSSAKSASGLENMLNAAAVGYGDADKFRKAILPILEQLNKHGDITKITEPQLRAMFKEAKRETKEREELTKFLNDFEMAMQNLKFQMMEMLYPLLDDLAVYLDKQDISGKVRQFGVFLKNSVEKYLPDVITFFKYLGDENGRDFIWNEIAYFFDTMGIKFKYYMKDILGLQSSENLAADMNKELGESLDAYEKKQSGLREKGLPPPYEINKSGTDKSSGTRGTSSESITRSQALIKQMAAANIPKFGAPLENMAGRKITSPFGENRPDGPHAGTDYKADVGEKILAPHGGKIFYGFNKRSGHFVQISDDKNKIVSVLAHMDPVGDELFKLQKRFPKDAEISTGTHVGFTGNTGRSTGPHLHWQTKYGGEFVDPSQYMRPHSTGTLGQYGSLFKDFGAGTDVILDDIEAVMTPDQMNSVVTGAGNIATTEMLESLDRNFQRLANIMAERTSLSRSQLSYIEKNQVNIA
jgi:murein DD-endopeptidase MepM/ murein hydrolase activator NlpD